VPQVYRNPVKQNPQALKALARIEYMRHELEHSREAQNARIRETLKGLASKPVVNSLTEEKRK
jgi:hypothetical protein